MKNTVFAVIFFMAPTLAYGATYYVAKTGRDSNTCTQANAVSTSKLTIAAGIGCLSSGDTLVIKAGTYTEDINTVYQPLPSGGGSWATATIVQGAQGETVTVQPPSGKDNALSVYARSWIIFNNLILDATNASYVPLRLGASAHDIRITNSELKNGKLNCAYTDDETVTDLQIINSKLHDCGSDPSYNHGVYLHGSNHLIEGNEIYNIASHGVHVYDNRGTRADNNIIRYNNVHNNGSRGILIGSGTNNLAYGNTVYSNGSGITIGFQSPDNNQAYGNKIYSNRGTCIDIQSGSTNSTVNDNTCWQNGSDTVLDQGNGSTVTANRVENPLVTTSTSSSPSRPSAPVSLQVGRPN